MYSQNNEEQIILKHFRGHEQGTILDIGAYDGKAFSNTYALIELGWHAVMVEASPQVFISLQRNMAGHDVSLVNACVAIGAESLIAFYDNAGAVATPNVENYEKWKNAADFEKIHLMSMNYRRLLDTFGTEFDMVNIDVEGGSTELFVSLFPCLPDVKLWCVEHDGNDAKIAAMGKERGYRVALLNGENIILTK